MSLFYAKPLSDLSEAVIRFSNQYHTATVPVIETKKPDLITCWHSSKDADDNYHMLALGA